MELEVTFQASVDVRINVDLTVEEYQELKNKSAKEKYEYFLSLGYFCNEYRGPVDHVWPLDVTHFETLEYIQDEDEDEDEDEDRSEEGLELHRWIMDGGLESLDFEEFFSILENS